MAGPTCSVLLREQLDTQQRGDIAELVRGAGWPKRDLLVATVEDVDDGPELYQPAEMDQIEAALGWRPRSQVLCVAMIGVDPQYHRLLAQGALALARAFGGVIDLGGTLSRVLDGAGQRAVVTYQVQKGQEAVYWVVDAQYLAAWIDDPWFRMVT